MIKVEGESGVVIALHYELGLNKCSIILRRLIT